MLKSAILFLFIFLELISTKSYSDSKGWKNLYTCYVTRSISKLVFKENNIYAFTANEGLLKSTDQGETWTTMRSGLPSTFITMVDLVGSENNHFILATRDGIFYEWNSIVQQWDALSVIGLPDHGNMTSLIQDSQGNLYTSYDHSYQLIYKSVDHGIHWKAILSQNNDKISHTKILIDNQDNLYVSGLIESTNNKQLMPFERKKYFIYRLQYGQTQWVNIKYSAENIFIMQNGLLGLVADNGTIMLIDLQYYQNHLSIKRRWVYSPPEQYISRHLIAVGDNELYFFSGKNLYHLYDILNAKSHWQKEENGMVNIPDVDILTMNENRLYSAGKPLNQDQLQSSINIYI